MIQCGCDYPQNRSKHHKFKESTCSAEQLSSDDGILNLHG